MFTFNYSEQLLGINISLKLDKRVHIKGVAFKQYLHSNKAIM